MVLKQSKYFFCSPPVLSPRRFYGSLLFAIALLLLSCELPKRQTLAPIPLDSTVKFIKDLKILRDQPSDTLTLKWTLNEDKISTLFEGLTVLIVERKNPSATPFFEKRFETYPEFKAWLDDPANQEIKQSSLGDKDYNFKVVEDVVYYGEVTKYTTYDLELSNLDGINLKDFNFVGTDNRREATGGIEASVELEIPREYPEFTRELIINVYDASAVSGDLPLETHTSEVFDVTSPTAGDWERKFKLQAIYENPEKTLRWITKETDFSSLQTISDITSPVNVPNFSSIPSSRNQTYVYASSETYNETVEMKFEFPFDSGGGSNPKLEWRILDSTGTAVTLFDSSGASIGDVQYLSQSEVTTLITPAGTGKVELTPFVKRSLVGVDDPSEDYELEVTSILPAADPYNTTGVDTVVDTQKYKLPAIQTLSGLRVTAMAQSDGRAATRESRRFFFSWKKELEKYRSDYPTSLTFTPHATDRSGAWADYQTPVTPSASELSGGFLGNNTKYNSVLVPPYYDSFDPASQKIEVVYPRGKLSYEGIDVDSFSEPIVTITNQTVGSSAANSTIDISLDWRMTTSANPATTEYDFGIGPFRGFVIATGTVDSSSTTQTFSSAFDKFDASEAVWNVLLEFSPRQSKLATSVSRYPSPIRFLSGVSVKNAYFYEGSTVPLGGETYGGTFIGTPQGTLRFGAGNTIEFLDASSSSSLTKTEAYKLVPNFTTASLASSSTDLKIYPGEIADGTISLPAEYDGLVVGRGFDSTVTPHKLTLYNTTTKRGTTYTLVNPKIDKATYFEFSPPVGSVVQITGFSAVSTWPTSTLPTGLTFPGNDGFGNTIDGIGNGAFLGETGFTTIASFASSITKIGVNAFKNTGITTLDLPDSVTLIGDSAFEGTTSLTSVSLGNGVLSINDSTFLGATALTSVSLGMSLNNIGRNGFKNTGLTTLAIPSSLRSIGSNAFENTSLTTLSLPDTLISIGDSAFKGTTSLTDVSLGAGLTTLSDNTFSGATSLSSVDFGTTLSRIGKSVFKDTALTNITLPNSVRSIDDEAFESAPLTELTIGTGITNIRARVFTSSSLTDVTINATSAPVLGANAFSVAISPKPRLNLSAGATIGSAGSAYNFSDTSPISSSGWGAYFRVPTTPTNYFTYGLVSGERGITGFAISPTPQNIVLPAADSAGAAIKFIAKDAFKNTMLTSVEIPDSVTRIEEGAFEENYNLTSLTFGVSSLLKTIEKDAFLNADIADLFLPDSLVNIAKNAFRGNYNLRVLSVGKNIEYIGNKAFGDTFLTSSAFAAPIAPILGDDVFSTSTISSFTTIKNTDIGYDFGDTDSKSATGWGAYFNAPSGAPTPIEAETLFNTSGDKVTGWSSGSPPTGANWVKIPSRIGGGRMSTIDTDAFNANLGSGVKLLVIPDSFKTIKENAFKDNQLTRVYLGHGIDDIEKDAFVGNAIDLLKIDATTSPEIGYRYIAPYVAFDAGFTASLYIPKSSTGYFEAFSSPGQLWYEHFKTPFIRMD